MPTTTSAPVVRFYEGPPQALIRTKGVNEDLCAVSPHVGRPRCKEIAPQKESFKEYRCDKYDGHPLKCIAYERTLLGIDTSRFAVWQPQKGNQ
jgi:hypothetical protein